MSDLTPHSGPIGKKESAFGRAAGWIGLVVVAVTAVLGIRAATGSSGDGDGGGTGDADSGDVVDDVEVDIEADLGDAGGDGSGNENCDAVTYEVVTDPLQSFDLTIENSTGGTEQFSEVGTWTVSYPCFEPGAFVYVAAGLDDVGIIECTITRNDAVVSNAVSRGEFVNVSCSN